MNSDDFCIAALLSSGGTNAMSMTVIVRGS